MIESGFTILLSILGLGVIIKNSAYFSWIWQLKEYRFDRLKSALKERPLKVWFQNAGWIKLVLLALFFISLALKISISNLYFKGVLSLILLLELLNTTRAALKRQLKKPQFTLKATILFILTVGTVIIIWATLGLSKSFSFIPWFIAFLIAERLIVGVNLAWLLFLKPPTYFYKQYLLQKAKNKIDSCPNLIKVGITGSYGKSTTKEIVSQILKSKYKVLKTPKNNNSAIGIAKTILKRLDSDHDIFICEMGAYKKGEIEQSAQIVSPQIGIITGITNQHQALFGSFQNIKEAKYELIEALPENGLAFFNGNNQHCRELKEKTKSKDAYLFGTNEESDFRAKSINFKPEGAQFTYTTPERKIEINLNLIATPSLENFLGAASCAYKIGVDLETIAQKGEDLKNSLASLTLQKGKKGALVIDDGYSANPEGAKAAFEYLREAFPKKKKIVVLRTLIELGSEAKKIHKKLGRILAKSADKVYLSSSEFAKTTKKEAKRAGLSESQIQIQTNPKKLIKRIEQELNSEQVLLIEGRVNKVISDYLLDQ